MFPILTSSVCAYNGSSAKLFTCEKKGDKNDIDEGFSLSYIFFILYVTDAVKFYKSLSSYKING